MRKSILAIAMVLAAAPFAVQAETINIYGWQNHSWEFVDNDGTDFDRIQSNAGNIGFAASVDTGMNGIHVNFQCEQFTYFNHFAGGTGWCNRNSKIGLSHPTAGEIMFATWLLPYNEAVAQWVDPFYDAGADSHTSIMGSVGANTIFYNTGDFDQQASASGPTTDFSGAEFNYAGGGYDTGFNRRQENIIQYWSPNWNGFVFRFAQTAGNRDESTVRNGREIDPVIRSSSLAYENGPLWLALTWQDHEDWTANSVGDSRSTLTAAEAAMIEGAEEGDLRDRGAAMEGSDAESIRLAARYIFDMGGGASFQISAMYEDLEYEFDRVLGFDSAMQAFGYGNSGTYTLTDAGGTEITAMGMRGTEFEGQRITGSGSTAARVGVDEDIKIERDAWMVSGKVKFGGPVDFRFSYMDSDDLEISCTSCSGDWNESAADAWNIGLFYTMPAGTELRLTYSEVDNDDNASYGQGISGTGLGVAGGQIEMFALGIVHWFD